MANNSLALLVKPPQFDLAATMADAARLRAANTQNSLSELKLKEAQGASGALDQYRAAAQSGDPNATAALTGYPELQAQISDALAGLEEADQRKAMLHGQKIGRAALSVANFPVGSTERRAEWDKQLDALKKDGAITDSEYQQWKKGEPTDLVLSQAISLGRTFDQLIADRESARQSERDTAARHVLMGDGADTIRSEESFADKAYWDKNAWRIGYGSDTLTLPDGTHRPVKEGDTTTRDLAEQDLSRRAPEFENTVIGQIGDATWKNYDDATREALRSVAYNYGSLPASVVNAARSGNKEMLAAAVEKLPANPERRAREAALIRGGVVEGGGSTRRQDLISVASDPNVSENIRELAETLLEDEKEAPTSYEDLSAEDKLKIRNAARQEVEAGIPRFGEPMDPGEMKSAIDEAEEALKQKLFGLEEGIQKLLGPDFDLTGVPKQAIDYLKAHPELVPQFKQKYGGGLASTQGSAGGG